MKNITKSALLAIAIALFATAKLHSQVTVGLDNWFNHEVKNGKLSHYTWDDVTEGGYSRWGKIFTDKGANITSLEKPTAEALKKVQVYIIVDPDTTKENPSPNYIMDDDIAAITKWVKKGGVLVVMANDAPNCEFTHLNKLSANFGIKFDHVSLKPVTNKQWEMGAFKNFSKHPVFEGVSKVYLKEVSSLTLSGNAKPVLEDDGKVIIAESKVGKGFVFAVGDPWIYNEYIDNDRLPIGFENRKAAENLTGYLLKNVPGKK